MAKSHPQFEDQVAPASSGTLQIFPIKEAIKGDKNMSFATESLNRMTTEEMANVDGGKQMYVDGILMEVSDLALRGLLNVAEYVVMKGVAMPGTGGKQDEIW